MRYLARDASSHPKDLSTTITRTPGFYIEINICSLGLGPSESCLRPHRLAQGASTTLHDPSRARGVALNVDRTKQGLLAWALFAC